MPWKESHRIMERANFINRLESGERMADLCREFGISRKTGYKFLDRYKRLGEVGLLDQSKRPIRLARSTPVVVEEAIVRLRHERPTWGAAKIREMLKRQCPGFKVPARSTVHEVLKRHGLIKDRRRKRFKACPTGLSQAMDSNDLWCTDFKGQFRLGNRSYCYPLTITDQYSRLLIACEGLESTKYEECRPVFEEAFREYGLPKGMRSDNGAPFSTRGLLGLSKLAVWWIKLGIEVERIEPGKPQQNGQHERMHLTLKQDTTRPASHNFLQQQERFDAFREDFNSVRPHEALDMSVPKTRYTASQRKYDGYTPEPDYPTHDLTCYVNKSGKVFVPKQGSFNLSPILSGEMVGLRQEDERLWLVSFSSLDLGHYDANEEVFYPREGKAR